MEIFSLGDISKTVGKILTDMSSLYDVGRRKRSAGLLLIDRTLDLLTPNNKNLASGQLTYIITQI